MMSRKIAIARRASVMAAISGRPNASGPERASLTGGACGSGAAWAAFAFAALRLPFAVLPARFFGPDPFRTLVGEVCSLIR